MQSENKLVRGWGKFYNFLIEFAPFFRKETWFLQRKYIYELYGHYWIIKDFVVSKNENSNLIKMYKIIFLLDGDMAPLEP